MKVLVFGASGSGTTTLAKELAKITGSDHLDADNYYWKPTNPPFQIKVAPNERQANLRMAFEKSKNVILSGSLVSWGDYWITAFDLAVFIYLKPSIRMKRLRQREFDRYGELLSEDTKLQQLSNAFLDWAKQYDDPNFQGRSLKVHKDWMNQLSCTTIHIDGSNELQSNVERVLEKINKVEM